ncbi:MAG: chloramphenicol resistance protein [Anaerotignum faecicola]
MKNIMEEVRKFLRTYPPLAEGKLHVDFLPEEAQSYSVEAVPAKEIVRSYVDGSTVRQFLFVVASREFFGDKTRQQLDNLSFYGDFSEWLREQTMAGKLPNLGEGRKVMLMEATTSGYAMAAEASMARYQIQCRMEFFQTR